MAKMSLLEKYGLKLRQTRKEAGMSQQHLSTKTGLHRTYISDVECGRRNISLENMEAFASALKKPIASFFPPSKHPFPKIR